ncbi:hypothetical protein GCM10017691_14710 [Pseudonocardia petroleophila]|uniref:AfsR/SARP family transcriptional regulator n=1 Tax=Pseudonocardia petroleophila TaxID=37331 RepID=A0A7G7MI25_9PSEU|nr:BTAD domain-containing putative transcriptional regulator [Pseudonocardia petroleophila]QNG52436.1 AfsR/SARP family transcriptional regulator [Pseudonocardia petroleophila]
MRAELVLLPRVAYRDEEVTGPRPRALLALLAADLRAGAGTARLAAGLWPDARPANPAKAVQVVVSRARAQLGADLIASTPTGYRLALPAEQVDAAAVLAHADTAARCARAGDHAAALAAAEEGLSAWEGAGAADTEDGPVAELRAEREPVRRALGRARALAMARLGRAAEAAGPLTDLARDHPRDEEVLLELLRSESATAGPAAALARYDTHRRRLRDELGADPGPALVAEHRRLLQDGGPAVRRGVRHEPNALLGRGRDVAAVGALLRSSRVTTVVGPGGLGKTRLAHVVAHAADQRVVHVVGLAGVTRDEDVLGEVATALGVGAARPNPPPPDALTGIVTALGAGPVLLVLLVLDNCEHVVGGAADLVGALVAMTRDLRVLATSRAPLGLTSESVYPLPALDRATTVELFGQRARAARPGVELPPDVVDELCAHLDGLPLAVELAAARTRVLPVTEIARRLDDRFALLRGGARDSPQRHRTLHAVVDWSWNLLDPRAQAAWGALSVFPAGFTAEAAAHLVDGDALEVLEHLADQSLLTVAEAASGTRFRMLETVREFGAARRDPAADPVAGLLAWAGEFGRRHHDAPFDVDAPASAGRIRAEQENLAFALRQAIARGDDATAAAAGAVLAALWTVESDFLRTTTLTRQTADLVARFRPGPADVEVTRTLTALSVTTAFVLQGPRASRALLGLRRLPAAPADTLVRALAEVLRTPGVLGPDPEPRRRLAAAGGPLQAAVAHSVDSYVRAHAADPEGALRAAERAAAALGTGAAAEPWIRVVARTRVAELQMLAGRGDLVLADLRAVAPMLDAVGASPALQLVWATALAHLHAGDPVAAQLLLDGAPATDDLDVGTATFDLAVRAELALALGDVDDGLALWRRSLERLRDPAGLDVDLPGPDPWALELHAAAVVAHARHGRPDLVADIVAELPHTLAALLDDPVEHPPGYVVASSLWGALLLALATADLARDDRQSTAARMTALAERLHVPQQFRPTMTVDTARRAARDADGPAYDDAVSSYAGLGPDELRVAAQVLLGSRV